MRLTLQPKLGFPGGYAIWCHTFHSIFKIWFAQFVQTGKKGGSDRERERDLICRSHCSGSVFLDQYSINQNWVRAQPHLAFCLPVGSSGSQRPDWQERIRSDFFYWQITGWNQQGKGLTHCKDAFFLKSAMCSFFWRYKIRICLPVHLALKVNLKTQISIIESYNHPQKQFEEQRLPSLVDAMLYFVCCHDIPLILEGLVICMSV